MRDELREAAFPNCTETDNLCSRRVWLSPQNYTIDVSSYNIILSSYSCYSCRKNQQSSLNILMFQG